MVTTELLLIIREACFLCFGGAGIEIFCDIHYTLRNWICECLCVALCVFSSKLGRKLLIFTDEYKLEFSEKLSI